MGLPLYTKLHIPTIITMNVHSSPLAIGTATNGLYSLLGAIVGAVCVVLAMAGIALVMAVLCCRRKLKYKGKKYTIIIILSFLSIHTRQ